MVLSQPRQELVANLFGSNSYTMLQSQAIVAAHSSPTHVQVIARLQGLYRPKPKAVPGPCQAPEPES